MKSRLEKYKRTRDFSKTTEPQGTEKQNKKSKLVFVVHEHHASHLHWDFRLELDGVLKSWAVPKGPSMDTKVKRLAVEVEDHPLEYAKFHGTIPEGQYGAGEVYIWDKGTWESEIDPHEGLKKGNLKFTLKGKKLSGQWVLIKTKWSGKQNQWLLMHEKEHLKKNT